MAADSEKYLRELVDELNAKIALFEELKSDLVTTRDLLKAENTTLLEAMGIEYRSGTRKVKPDTAIKSYKLEAEIARLDKVIVTLRNILGT